MTRGDRVAAWLGGLAFSALLAWWAAPALGEAVKIGPNDVAAIDTQVLVTYNRPRADVPQIQAIGSSVIGTAFFNTTQRVSLATRFPCLKTQRVAAVYVGLVRLGTDPVPGTFQVCLHSEQVSSFFPSATTLSCSAVYTSNKAITTTPLVGVITTLLAGVEVTTGQNVWIAVHVNTIHATAGNIVRWHVVTGPATPGSRTAYKGIGTTEWSIQFAGTSSALRAHLIGGPY